MYELFSVYEKEDRGIAHEHEHGVGGGFILTNIIVDHNNIYERLRNIPQRTMTGIFWYVAN